MDHDEELELPPEDGDTDETLVPLEPDEEFSDAEDGDPYDDAAHGEDDIEKLDETEEGSDDAPFEDGEVTDVLDITDETPWGPDDERPAEPTAELDDDEEEAADDGAEGPEAEDETLPELSTLVQGEEDDEEDALAMTLPAAPEFGKAPVPWTEALRFAVGDLKAVAHFQGELLVVGALAGGRFGLARIGAEGEVELRADLPKISRGIFEGAHFLLEGEETLRVSPDGSPTKLLESHQEELDEAELPDGVVREASVEREDGVSYLAARLPRDRTLAIVEREPGAATVVATLEPEVSVTGLTWDPMRQLLWLAGPFGLRAYRRP